MKTFGKCLTIGIMAGFLYILPQYVSAEEYDSREKVETIQLDTIKMETPKQACKTNSVDGLDMISSADYSTNSSSQDPISKMISDYKKRNGPSKPNLAMERYIKESKKVREDLKNKRITPDEVIMKMNVLLEKYHKEVGKSKKE